jgi:hypothetical protein
MVPVPLALQDCPELEAAAAIGAAVIATAAAPAANSGAMKVSLILTVLLLRLISNICNSRIAAQRSRAIGANTHQYARQQESMPTGLLGSVHPAGGPDIGYLPYLSAGASGHHPRCYRSQQPCRECLRVAASMRHPMSDIDDHTSR